MMKGKRLATAAAALAAVLATAVTGASGGADGAAIAVVLKERVQVVEASGDYQPQSSPPGMELVAQKGHVALHADLATGEFALEDMRTGSLWTSNPLGREEDDLAQGAAKNELSSLLTVTDVVTETGVTKKRNSFTGSVNKGGVSVTKTEAGFQAVFRFPEQKYEIPLTVSLLEDSLYVSIDTEAIKEEGESRIFSIGLLPYFGAQDDTAEGWMVLPDESGSLMRFNNGKFNYGAYRCKIYGRDRVTWADYESAASPRASLPVYGLRTDSGGLLAVMEEGAGCANVNAFVSGYASRYNTAYFDADVRVTHTGTIGYGYNSKDVTLYEEGALSCGELGVRYFPLEPEESGIAGMAALLRKYLIRQENMQPVAPNGLPLAIHTLGAVEVRRSVLGVKMDVLETVTTFDRTRELAEELRGEGVDSLTLLYDGWSKREAKGQLTSEFDLIGGLGGEKKLRELATTVGGGVFLHTQTVLYENSGLFGSRGGIKDLSLSTVSAKEYRRDTFFPESDAPELRIARAEKAAGIWDTLADKLAGKTGLGLSTAAAGQLAYSDFSDGGTPRTEQVQLTAEALRRAAGKTALAGDNPNFYALPSVSAVFNLPDGSGRYDVTDEAIPFYALVLRGLVPAYGTPVNSASHPEKSFLWTLASGSLLQYDLVGGDPSDLKETAANTFYAGDYAAWKATILRQYGAMDTLYAATRQAAVTDFEWVQSGVARTVYENGVSTLVNMTDEKVEVDGVTVEPLNWVLREEG